LIDDTLTAYAARTPEATTRAHRLPVALGAHLVDDGADFAVLAPHATDVSLCLFDETALGQVERQYSLNTESQGMWSAHVPGVRVGQRYGYRGENRWAAHNRLRTRT